MSYNAVPKPPCVGSKRFGKSDDRCSHLVHLERGRSLHAGATSDIQLHIWPKHGITSFLNVLQLYGLLDGTAGETGDAQRIVLPAYSCDMLLQPFSATCAVPYIAAAVELLPPIALHLQ